VWFEKSETFRWSNRFNWVNVPYSMPLENVSTTLFYFFLNTKIRKQHLRSKVIARAGLRVKFDIFLLFIKEEDNGYMKLTTSYIIIQRTAIVSMFFISNCNY
jgi:hypothetical protein